MPVADVAVSTTAPKTDLSLDLLPEEPAFEAALSRCMEQLESEPKHLFSCDAEPANSSEDDETQIPFQRAGKSKRVVEDENDDENDSKDHHVGSVELQRVSEKDQDSRVDHFVESDGVKRFYIDRIDDVARTSKKTHYFVHWFGFEDKDNTWVTREKVNESLLLDFYKRFPEKRRPRHRR